MRSPNGHPTYVAIDFETANRARDSACAVGIAVIEGGAIRQAFQRLVRPPTNDFSDWNFRVHGIHWKDVVNEPDFATVWSQIQDAVGQTTYFVAHNAGFDQQVLAACCACYGIAAPDNEFLCTIEAASALWHLETYQLPRVCEFLGIPLTHHNAKSDAEASANILLRAMMQGYSPASTAADGVSLWAAKNLSSEIMELVSSIMEDGVVDPSEIRAAAEWIERNKEAASVWPGSELQRCLGTILRDGIIDQTELDDFRSLCCALLGLHERKKTRSPTKKPANAMSVCFTGFGPGKKQMQSAAKTAGYHVVATVTKSLDYLVCGPLPGPAKIALATERGAKILTAPEWQTVLAKGGTRNISE